MMGVASLIEALKEEAEDVERLVESCKRKSAILQANISDMRAVLAFHEQNVSEDDFLPHMSVRKLFKSGEIRRYCLQALKAAGGCLDTRELARVVVAKKGLDVDDVVLRKKIVFSVMQVMKTARRYHLVVGEGKRKGVRMWRLSEVRRT